MPSELLWFFFFVHLFFVIFFLNLFLFPCFKGKLQICAEVKTLVVSRLLFVYHIKNHGVFFPGCKNTTPISITVTITQALRR